MKDLNDSHEEIKLIIEKLRDPLNELMVYSGEEDFNEEIIRLSEILDNFIAKYMIYTKEI